MNEVRRNHYCDEYGLLLRNFSQLHSTAVFAFRVLRASNAPFEILQEANSTVSELRDRVDDIRTQLAAALAAVP